MTDAIFTHDAGVSAFEDAGGVVETADDGAVSFNWDEQHVVTVDAPANLAGAFDTDQFYKIEGATIARPIKQPYMVGDEIEWYKKPAEELDKAAWSFDNAPFTLGHPDTGMVKNVDDIHGFWRNPRYKNDADRLVEDLYVPVEDEEALQFIEENSDVSVGFYNRVHSDYTGDTGNLSDDDVDGFQVDMFGNHIAGVEQGRCSSEHGCGLDAQDHGNVINTDQTTAFERQSEMTESEEMFSEGDEVTWMADAVVAHNPDDEGEIMIEILDDDGDSTEMVTTVGEDTIMHKNTMARSDSCNCTPTTDAPSGIYEGEDGGWYGIAPSETADDEPKYELDNCNDVKDAWNLRGSGDYDIERSTLESRIKRAADSHDCPMENRPWEDSESMSDSDSDTDSGFNIPDLSADAIVEQNDAVREIKEERDSLKERVDEMRSEIEDAFDAAENFQIELDDEECPCEAVEDLVADLDEKVDEVEDLREELTEYREDDIEDRLDRLEDLGADRDEWEASADEADDPLDVLDEEIERREEVLDSADVETSVKDVDSSTDSSPDDDSTGTSMSGTRTFGRGYGT